MLSINLNIGMTPELEEILRAIVKDGIVLHTPNVAPAAPAQTPQVENTPKAETKKEPAEKKPEAPAPAETGEAPFDAEVEEDSKPFVIDIDYVRKVIDNFREERFGEDLSDDQSEGYVTWHKPVSAAMKTVLKEVGGCTKLAQLDPAKYQEFLMGLDHIQKGPKPGEVVIAPF